MTLDIIKDFLLNHRDFTASIVYLIGFFITGLIVAIIGNLKAIKNNKKWEATDAWGIFVLFWPIAIPATMLIHLMVYTFKFSVYLGRCIAIKLKSKPHDAVDITPPVYRKPPLRP